MRPTSEDELAALIRDAAASGTKLELRGGGSKAAVGAPRDAAIVDLRGFDGIVDYDPRELVMTVRAGTPLAVVQQALAAERQRLAFDPFDHGPLFGQPAGSATIGGVIAAGVAGSRRVSGGGARDHLLGFRAVSGRGEAFVAGAKVVKNVTGYDVPKLAAGSWGRLFALTEISVKTLPRPAFSATHCLAGLDPAAAVRAMAAAMGSQAEVVAAAHLPDRTGNPSLTLFRLEGVPVSIDARAATLHNVLGSFGRLEPSDDGIWNALRDLEHLPRDRTLWRVNLPASTAPALVAALAPLGAAWSLDWAGGLAWIAHDGDAALIRELAAAAGGHAMLLRAPEDARLATPALHPQSPGVAALETRVRRAFDPGSCFETGRF